MSSARSRKRRRVDSSGKDAVHMDNPGEAGLAVQMVGGILGQLGSFWKPPGTEEDPCQVDLGAQVESTVTHLGAVYDGLALHRLGLFQLSQEG